MKEQRLRTILWCVVCAAVAAYFAFDYAAEKVVPEKWYEVDEGYFEEFDAAIYVGPYYIGDETRVYPCVATIGNSSGEYSVEQVYLPALGWTNCYASLGNEISTDKRYELTIDLDEYEIKVGTRASNMSYEVVDGLLTGHGRYCASTRSMMYHYRVDGTTDCRIAKEIEDDDIIHFATQREAEFFGYSMCENCEKHPVYDEDY